MSYLFHVWGNQKELRWITQTFPWVLWYLWKNRNSLLFEGIQYDGEQTYSKAKEEAHLWLLAQEVEHERASLHHHHQAPPLEWRPPSAGILKCNIGMRWSKRKRELGAAWVLRDSGGTVLLHSRRSFADITTKDEAHFMSLAWAIESMISHKCGRVYFYSEGSMLINAINRPRAWPSFTYKVLELRRLLGTLLEWRVMSEGSFANRGARLIANSVVCEDRFQSYVTRGAPRWLSQLFFGRV